MKWNFLIKAACAVADAFAKGVLGRGRKTQRAGETAGDIIRKLDKKKGGSK